MDGGKVQLLPEGLAGILHIAALRDVFPRLCGKISSTVTVRHIQLPGRVFQKTSFLKTVKNQQRVDEERNTSKFSLFTSHAVIVRNKI